MLKNINLVFNQATISAVPRNLQTQFSSAIKSIICIGLMFVNLTAFSDPGHLFDVKKRGMNLLVSTTIPNHTYKSAGIKLNTPGFSISDISNVCQSVVNDFCLFSVDNTSTKHIPFTGSGAVLQATICLNGKAQLSCQNYQFATDAQQTLAYVPNFAGNNISLCNINPDNGLLSNCFTTGESMAQPTDIIFNPDGSLAYVTNYQSNTVTACKVDIHSGALSDCFTAATFASGTNPQGMAINAAGTKAYVVLDCTNTIENCSINQTNGELENCIETSPEPLYRPSDIIINSKGTLAYIPNRGDSTLSICIIDPNTGLIEICNNSGSNFTTPEGVSFNSTENLIYVGNDGDNSITYCTVDDIDGTLRNCQLTGGIFNGFGNIILNNTDTYAYVPNSNSNTVSICKVDFITGELSECADSQGTGFNQPSSVMLR